VAARSSWKGYLNLSLVSIPVKAYPATNSEGRGIRLNQLHVDCHSRINYKKTCPVHGEVSNDAIISRTTTRNNLFSMMLAAIALAALLSGGPVRAAEKKEDGIVLNLKGELTKNDPKDKVLNDSPHKVHPFSMLSGKAYRIDLKSKDFDAFLRLEDPSGRQVAVDDDSGGDHNAQIIYKAKTTGKYKVIATSYDRKPGKYTLTIAAAGPGDLLVARAREIGKSAPAERKRFLADIEKHFQEKNGKLTQQDADLAMQLAGTLAPEARALAVNAYNTLARTFAQASDPKIARMAKTLQGTGRRVNLPGHEIVVRGKTIEGKPVDWKSYRGKIVLVDFWATWCGPCRAELPNVKKLYEEYHDRGFDVLGISVDENKKALVQFLEKENLPWTCIHDQAEGKGESLSDCYSVEYIPLAILVDRQGRVISMQAGGPELRGLLEKLLGPEKNSGKGKAKKKTP